MRVWCEGLHDGHLHEPFVFVIGVRENMKLLGSHRCWSAFCTAGVLSLGLLFVAFHANVFLEIQKKKNAFFLGGGNIRVVPLVSNVIFNDDIGE